MSIKEKVIKFLGGEIREIQDVSSSDEAGMRAIFGVNNSKSGIAVTEENSMKLSAVYACVRILSESIASLPLKIYKCGPDGSKKVAYEHPLYTVLHDISNYNQSSFEFRETIIAHLNLWGNAYVKKILDKTGRVVELEPIEPWKVRVYKDETRPKEFQLQYAVNTKEGYKIYFKDEILHIKGLSFNGKDGLSPIAYARESIGLGLAAERFGSQYFGEGTNLGGTLESPTALSDAAYERLKSDLLAKRQGLDNAHSVMILEEGLKYAKTIIPPEDSQFIETRKFQLNEIARIFRVPPHMIADLDKATFSNIEHQGIGFVVHTLRPWLVRIEQAIFMQLLTEEERKTYFVEFNVDGLLRGDFKTRQEGYAIGRQNGWLNANDIRKLENMDPIPDGDAYLVNGNMISIKAAMKNVIGKGGEKNNDN
ncbi:MAG: phage portal protein [Clostridium sp.]|uniref:phage portal protein n=1 Tax=Clostridium sp. TaxID=1506 RepID=UPI00301EBD76